MQTIEFVGPAPVLRAYKFHLFANRNGTSWQVVNDYGFLVAVIYERKDHYALHEWSVENGGQHLEILFTHRPLVFDKKRHLRDIMEVFTQYRPI